MEGKSYFLCPVMKDNNVLIAIRTFNTFTWSQLYISPHLSYF